MPKRVTYKTSRPTDPFKIWNTTFKQIKIFLLVVQALISCWEVILDIKWQPQVFLDNNGYDRKKELEDQTLAISEWHMPSQTPDS